MFRQVHTLEWFKKNTVEDDDGGRKHASSYLTMYDGYMADRLIGKRVRVVNYYAEGFYIDEWMLVPLNSKCTLLNKIKDFK